MKRFAALLLAALLTLGVTTAPQAAGRSQVSGTKFATVRGTQLYLNNRPFVVHGATTYGQMDNATAEVALAKLANLNTLEIVEYETNYHDLTTQMTEATWTRIDNFIAVARANGLHIVLNLSSYGQSLMASGYKPTTYDWNPFLSFVTNRINTVTGVRYRSDPTIILFQLYGEIDAPNYSVPLRGTTQETTDFFARTLGQLRALDPNHPLSSGGLSYINDSGSGIDWHTIVADPNNNVCSMEINSYPDRNTTAPAFSAYCQTLNKPWFLAAWSSCYNNKWGGDDINDWPAGDSDMAAHAQDMYNVAHNNNPTAPGPAMASVGTDFWNLEPNAAQFGTCGVGTQFPLTFAAIQNNAPA